MVGLPCRRIVQRPFVSGLVDTRVLGVLQSYDVVNHCYLRYSYREIDLSPLDISRVGVREVWLLIIRINGLELYRFGDLVRVIINATD